MGEIDLILKANKSTLKTHFAFLVDLTPNERPKCSDVFKVCVVKAVAWESKLKIFAVELMIDCVALVFV